MLSLFLMLIFIEYIYAGVKDDCLSEMNSVGLVHKIAGHGDSYREDKKETRKQLTTWNIVVSIQHYNTQQESIS
ncbi:unnamed protein product [Macrosiphum euphorbiae]|uniref:Uncharacterized protein n=1 Tax=Macrosiphum euphorbiae TaxID=13131 RepID=A0AAV0WW38_9HEMI|nr:unnamed protein product [Macrosiphum euphorbiae]